MLKEIVDQKQTIITHIQQKLANLRQQRNNLQKQKYISNQNYPQTNFHKQYVKGSKQQKMQVQNKLDELKKLYEAKKQLKSAGISTNDPAEIYKYRNDPKWVNYVQKRKKKVAEDAQKKKIVDQEMIKTKSFLKSKKADNKQLKGLQIMNYRNILKEKQKQLYQYDTLVNKKPLSRLEKQQLIKITFKFLKTSLNFADKEIIRSFLLANPQFCSHFYITHTQINRDLDVFETKQQCRLDETQFYQFIKSIQFTNPNLNPNLARKQKTQKKKKQQIKGLYNIKQNKENPKEKNGRQLYRNILDYLRKLFKNMDRSHQSIVERSKFVIALQKGLYVDDKMKGQLQSIKQLAKFMTKKTKQQCQKDYYKQLQSKYITFTQIQSFCRQFCYKICQKQKASQKQQNSQKSLQNLHQEQKQTNAYQNQQQNQYEQSQADSQINLSAKQGKIITENDYQRYGWKNKPQNNKKMTINQLDKCYKQVQQKYETEIRWNGLNLTDERNYTQDFKQLQEFIKLQENKNKNIFAENTQKK